MADAFAGRLRISSNINEGTRVVYFFYEKISHAQKAQKAQKGNKNKRGSFKCA